MSKNKKKVPVLFIAAVLIVGVVAGTGIWLIDAEVPIEYDEPYTVSMSQSETEDYNWQGLQFRESTTLKEKADFSATGSSILYHQYVKIENPAKTEDLYIEAQVEEPESNEFDNDMGFITMEGIVEPGNADSASVEEWGSTNYTVRIQAGETDNFTVIYTLGVDAPQPGEFKVQWTFSELEEAPTMMVEIPHDNGEYNEEQYNFLQDKNHPDPYILEVYVEENGEPFTGNATAKVTVTNHHGEYEVTPTTAYTGYADLDFTKDGTAEIVLGNGKDVHISYEGLDVNEITDTIEVSFDSLSTEDMSIEVLDIDQ